MIIEVNGSKPGTSHKVDTESVTCTCQDFRFKRSNYSKESINRQCKHISKVFRDHPELAPVQVVDDSGVNSNLVDKDGISRYSRTLFSPYVKIVENIILKFPDVKRVVLCGEFERLLDRVDKLTFLVICNSFQSLCSYIEQSLFPIVVSRSESKVEYLIDGYIPVEVIYTDEYGIYARSFFYNSSKEEVLRIQKICELVKYDLSLQGLRSGDEYLPLNSEEDLYKLIGEEYKKPYER
jgi:hypothetical protein